MLIRSPRRKKFLELCVLNFLGNTCEMMKVILNVDFKLWVLQSLENLCCRVLWGPLRCGLIVLFQLRLENVGNFRDERIIWDKLMVRIDTEFSDSLTVWEKRLDGCARAIEKGQASRRQIRNQQHFESMQWRDVFDISCRLMWGLFACLEGVCVENDPQKYLL